MIYKRKKNLAKWIIFRIKKRFIEEKEKKNNNKKPVFDLQRNI